MGVGALVSALSVRRELVCVGYTNGGVAAMDMRCATAEVDEASSSSFSSYSSVLWSDVLHAGAECRSVDLSPSAGLLLTAGGVTHS